jgi:hypothetical protein
VNRGLYSFTILPKPNGTMIDIDLTSRNILTDNRKEKFLKVQQNQSFYHCRRRYFQMHNSAVMRSCEFWNSRVKCNRTALRQKYR